MDVASEHLMGTWSTSSNPEKATLHAILMCYFCTNPLSWVFCLCHYWWALCLLVAHILLLARVYKYNLWLGRKRAELDV
jgi:energy-coupling factor transporter transmembrane protein EcfT